MVRYCYRNPNPQADLMGSRYARFAGRAMARVGLSITQDTVGFRRRTAASEGGSQRAGLWLGAEHPAGHRQHPGAGANHLCVPPPENCLATGSPQVAAALLVSERTARRKMCCLFLPSCWNQGRGESRGPVFFEVL